MPCQDNIQARLMLNLELQFFFVNIIIVSDWLAYLGLLVPFLLVAIFNTLSKIFDIFASEMKRTTALKQMSEKQNIFFYSIFPSL